MLHRFRIVFSRSLGDDFEYIEERQAESRKTERISYTEAILAQLRAEIDQNEVFKGRFRFSQLVSFYYDTYYVLGEIDYEGADDDGAAFDKFMEEFQVCYDEYGMAGHFQVVPNESQPVLAGRLKAVSNDWNMVPYAPAWLDE